MIIRENVNAIHLYEKRGCEALDYLEMKKGQEYVSRTDKSEET